jgi:hypothetical protein
LGAAAPGIDGVAVDPQQVACGVQHVVAGWQQVRARLQHLTLTGLQQHRLRA